MLVVLLNLVVILLTLLDGGMNIIGLTTELQLRKMQESLVKHQDRYMAIHLTGIIIDGLCLISGLIQAIISSRRFKKLYGNSLRKDAEELIPMHSLETE